jgi:hypothetical protein
MLSCLLIQPYPSSPPSAQPAASHTTPAQFTFVFPLDDSLASLFFFSTSLSSAMPSLHFILGRQAAIAVAFLSFPRHVQALNVEYCSNLNTASGDPSELSMDYTVLQGSFTNALNLTAYWQYQSNGWCHDHCVEDYAFAIVQGYNCWCSNYAPGVTSSSGDCNTECPGYNEFCGGTGYFGYIALNQAPAGTIGASGSTASGIPVVSNFPITRYTYRVALTFPCFYIFISRSRLRSVCCIILSAILTFLQQQVTVTASGSLITIFFTVTPASAQVPSTSSLFVRSHVSHSGSFNH